MGKRSTTPKIRDYPRIERPAEPEGVWTQAYRRESWEIKFGDLRILVHHYVGYPPETWLVTCDAVRIGPKVLVSTSVDDAKREAFDMVHATVAEWMRGMTTFHEGQAK